MVKENQIESPLQEIKAEFLDVAEIQLFIKRDDLIHPQVSGNKWRKLKYNILEAKKQGKSTLLTFGGAFSNHLYALAAAGNNAGLKTIGLVRGEATEPLNPTLSFCVSQGMELQYLSRTAYREKNTPEFLSILQESHPDAFIIPEGGTNEFALPGCAELIEELPNEISHIVTAVGSGGTLAGIISGLKPHQKAVGIPVLKGADYLLEEVQQLTPNKSDQWEMETDYHFGGYAKVTKELVSFMDKFQEDFGIPLEPIYTAKMLYGLFDLVKKGYFEKGTQIVAVHTGGLQGLAGMNDRLQRLRNTP